MTIIRSIAVSLVVFILLPIAACGGETTGPDRVRDLVSADPYPRLQIHVDYVEERRPRAAVKSRLAGGLAEVLDKPGGVNVVVGEVLPESAPRSGWTFSELRQFVESQAAKVNLADDTVGAYTLFVDGSYNHDGGGTVLGVAWANRYAVLFHDDIEAACRSGQGLLPGLRSQLCENAELTIWRHEMGHVLGLVDKGAPLTSDHADPEHSAHCKHDGCVMYWAFRGAGSVDVLRDRLLGGDESAPDFDHACRADLESVMDSD